MLKLVLTRALFIPVAVLLVSSIVFGLFQTIPGDPARLIAGDKVPESVVEAVRKQYGFDKPLYVQYMLYMGRLVKGDLGVSVYNRVPVFELVLPRFLNTLKLAALAILVSVLVSLALGVVSAARAYGLADRLFTVLSLVGVCTPIFLVGLTSMYVFSVWLRILPLVGMGSWNTYVLPVASIAIYHTAFMTRIVRACMIEELLEEHITVARAKGLGEAVVVWKHALKNALLPVLTVFGLQFGYALGGAIVTETVFAWPGLGRLMVESILTRDLPVTQGSLIVFSIAFIVVNMCVDVAYAWVNPRIVY